jgi:hypothetical protein
LRPIAWGFIATFGGGILWVLFSAVAAAGEFGTGRVDPGMMMLVYLFGILFFFSLPVAIVIEAVKWAQRRKQKKLAAVSQPPVVVSDAAPQATKFCTKCGTTLETVGATGARICPKCLTVYP